MNELITYLEGKNDDDIVDNLKNFLQEKRTLKEKNRVFKEMSARVSDKIMGPPANKCMNEQEKTQYDSIMDEIMVEGVWNNEEKLNEKINKYSLK